MIILGQKYGYTMINYLLSLIGVRVWKESLRSWQS